MMSDIVEGLCLMLAALVVACCFGYTKGWCCDGGGKIKSEFQSTNNGNATERRIRKQIKKMVATEKEIKRLAMIATSGTDENPNDYIIKIRNLLFPSTNRPVIIETNNLEQTIGVSSGSGSSDNFNTVVALNSSSNFLNNGLMEFSSFQHPLVHSTMIEPTVLMNSHPITDLDYYDDDSISLSFQQQYVFNDSSNNNNIITDEMPPSYEDCMRGMQYSYV